MKFSLFLVALGLLEPIAFAATAQRLTKFEEDCPYDPLSIQIFSMESWARTMPAAVVRPGGTGLTPKIPIPPIFVPTMIRIFQEHISTIEHNTDTIKGGEKFNETMEQEVALQFYEYHYTLKTSLNRLLNDRRLTRLGFKLMKADDEFMKVAKKYTEVLSPYLDALIELGSNDEEKRGLSNSDKEFVIGEINDWINDWQSGSSKKSHSRTNRYRKSSRHVSEDDDEKEYELPEAALQIWSLDTWTDRVVTETNGYHHEIAIPQTIVELFNENTHMMKDNLDDAKKLKFNKDEAADIAFAITYYSKDLEATYNALTDEYILSLFKKYKQDECLVEAVKKRRDVFDSYLEEMLRLTTRDKDEGFLPETKKKILNNLNNFGKKFSTGSNTFDRYRPFGKLISTIEVTVEEQLLAKKH